MQGSGKDAKGFGLAKILEKHIDDFKDFIGDTKETKLINGLNEIIEKGKVLSKNGVNTIILSENNKEYRVGLSKGFNGKNENNWIITAYEYNPQIKRGSAETSYHDTFTDKAPLSNSKEDTTTIKQTKQDMEKEIPYNTQVEFDRQGMAEFQRKIESGEIQLEKATQKHLDNIYKQYEMLQES